MSEPTILNEVPIGDVSTNPQRHFNMSPLKSSLISGLPSLIGGGISALSQYLTNEKNYRRQLEMYRENRDYNTPEAQMQRFRDAGLNPNLIYGMTNTAQPVAVGNAQAPNFDFIGNSSVSALNDYRLTDSNNINRAIGYMNYGMSRVNLHFLTEEKRVAYMQMVQALNNLKTDGSIKSFERELKKINYEYDKSLYDEGLPPDLAPRDRSVIGLIASLVEWLGIMDSKDFTGILFPFNNK